MNQHTIPNLTKACDVLRQLAAHENGLTQAELEALVMLPRATAFRILTTFRNEGFVQKNGKRYVPGLALGQMAGRAVSGMALRQAAIPVLKSLSDKTGETSHLAIPSGSHSLILEVCDGPGVIRVASRPGTLADLHCSSTGKVFLAFLPEDTVESLLSQMQLQQRTAHSLTERDGLRKELQATRERGYAIDDEEYHDGVRCLAAPVRDARDGVIAAIGVTGTAGHLTPENDEAIASAVLAAAARLESQLKHV